jgi:2-polyprenyl-3-methyl-5-hydroxy-6-metoxy-1,4-benzoquinol methylase
MDASRHWNDIYRTRSPQEVSWYEPVPETSLDRVRAALADRASRSVIDVGGGASTLVDHLVRMNLTRLAVLDVAKTSLDVAKRRLGDPEDHVEWIEADVTKVSDIGHFGIWHDRAVFHFLTDPSDRASYVALCERTLAPGGIAIVATFAHDGPEMCSGLPVLRYAADELAEQCGSRFELIGSELHVHTTPHGGQQAFLYASFRRLASDRQLVSA